MRKRWLCGLLALCLLVGMLPGIVLQAHAAVNMKVSQDMIDVLKKMEGFSAYPYWDYSQWTVGYGTECPDDKLEEYKANGIPEKEAEALLYEEMVIFETEVNNFLNKYKLTVEQHQFDALVSLSYNCGGNWTRETNGYLSLAVRSGDTGNVLIYAMSLYSKAHTDYVLIKRRLAEANMYINGVYKAYNYDKDAIPATYKYVFLDGNGGEVNYAIHGYDASDPMTVVTSFSHIPGGVDAEGNAFLYEFAGWYTEREGGTLVEKLDGSLSNGAVLFAQWKDPEGNIVSLPKGEPADNLEITTTVDKVNVRTGPGGFYPKVATLAKNSKVTIVETFSSNGVLWGRYDGGWISLSNTNYQEVLNSSQVEQTWPQAGTVTGTNVNVRNGPGTGNDVQYQLNSGDRVVISESYDDGNLLWGKLEDGNWICLSYVKLDSQEEEGETQTPVLTGVTLVKAPAKTDYVQMQDDIELSGSVLQLQYSDGTVSALTLTRSMITSYSNAKLGEATVKAAYKGYSFQFVVNIVPATVTFLNYDGTVLSQAQYAYGAAVTEPETPVKPADEAGEYVFAGWDKEVTACAGDVTYTAVFELYVEKFPVTFCDYDGTVISVTEYALGEEVTEPPTPTRPADEQWEYEFIGWDQEVTACDGEKTYTAVYQQVAPKFTVTFLNFDGTVLSSNRYSRGENVTPPSTPVRPADENGEYVFVGWDQEVTACDGDKTYTAVYELKPPMYTVTFLNYDGTVLSTKQYTLGEEVTEPKTPSRAADAYGEYEFAGWNKEVTACTGDAVYIAVFERISQGEEGTWPRPGKVTGVNVNVRTGPGTSYDKADYQLNTGDSVMIYETVYDGTTYWWGKLEDGNWICMNYVSTVIVGDFDGDEIVDEADVDYLLGYLLFPDWYPISSPADFDGSGTVDEADVDYLLGHLLFPDWYPLSV